MINSSPGESGSILMTENKDRKYEAASPKVVMTYSLVNLKVEVIGNCSNIPQVRQYILNYTAFYLGLLISMT